MSLANPKDASPKETRRFAFLLAAVFSVIAAGNWALHAFLVSKRALIPWYVLAGIAGFALIMAALNVRPVLRYIYIGWMSFAHFMGTNLTRLILILFYYIAITPLGLVMRITGHDALQLKKKPADSYWEPRPVRPIDPDGYRKQY
jgi:hypothetical protein